jgi:hypothetical protein
MPVFSGSYFFRVQMRMFMRLEGAERLFIYFLMIPCVGVTRKYRPWMPVSIPESCGFEAVKY